MNDASPRLCACGSPALPRTYHGGPAPSKCEPCHKAYQARHTAAHRVRLTEDGRRNREYRNKYGITLEIYEKMYGSQNGACAICERHSTNFAKRLCVDHCHTTGAVRGLLCHDCNTALGKFRDNAGALRRAITYLEGD